MSKYYSEWYEKNREREKARQRKNYHDNREKRLAQQKIYRETNKEKVRVNQRKSFLKNLDKNRPKINLIMKKYYDRLRLELITLLGAKCSNPNCLVIDGCTDIRCLQLDHINGGAKKDYHRLGGRFINQRAMYSYYIDNQDEAKATLQVLCANCNWIKRHESINERGGAPPIYSA